MCKISVIVPVYNVEKYINKCIDSILAQTFIDYEIILVDDGSTDKSGEICDEYANNYEQIRVIHKENGGLATAKNAGLDEAKGSFVSFIDSDDWIESDMLESLYEPLKGTQNCISICGRYIVDELTEELEELFVLNHEETWDSVSAIKRFLLWNCIDGSSCDKLFPMELIGKLRFPSGYISEDIPFTYEILKQCNEVMHIGKPKYYYFQRSGSLSRPSFSRTNRIAKKSQGLVKYNKEIRRDVLVNYPSLRSEADYFYYSRCLVFQSWMTYHNVFNPMFLENVKEIRSASETLLNNDYFDKYEKIAIKSYSRKTYVLICLIKHILYDLLKIK